jgi:hypothetical protein
VLISARVLKPAFDGEERQKSFFEAAQQLILFSLRYFKRHFIDHSKHATPSFRIADGMIQVDKV